MSEHQPHILIVDDDTLLLDMYSTKFREEGFSVDVAKGSEEALAKVESDSSIDVILIDIVMPGMDGFELIEKIAAGRTGSTPQLIVLSNQGQDSDIKRATDLGADGYIVKANSTPSEVVERVTAFANEASGGGASTQQ